MWLSEIGGLSWPMARLKSRHYLEIALENPTSIAHQVASSLALDRRQHATAVAEAEKAIALSPNDPQSHIAMARAWIFTMRTSEAVDILKGLMQRDPRNIATPLCLQGLAYFTEGRVEEAVVSIERGLTHNPKLPRYSGVLASAYAQLGRDQEAKAALERFADEFVYTPSLQVVMYAFPFKDSKVADRLAAGLLEAGLEGQLTDYYNANDMRKLEAEEIRNLCFGRRMTGFDTIIGSDMWIERSEDGRAMMQDAWGSSDGKSWIEGDMLCNQWEARWGGLKHCCDVYHNPQGTSEMKNEYVTVSDFGIFALSVADRER
jgi:Flp pilus assembly protein TadD